MKNYRKEISFLLLWDLCEWKYANTVFLFFRERRSRGNLMMKVEMAREWWIFIFLVFLFLFISFLILESGSEVDGGRGKSDVLFNSKLPRFLSLKTVAESEKVGKWRHLNLEIRNKEHEVSGGRKFKENQRISANLRWNFSMSHYEKGFLILKIIKKVFLILKKGKKKR